jgi:4-aminobutyrate aminotransferase
MDTRKAIEWQHKYLIPAVGTYYDEPLVVSHGKGHYLWDLDGHEYLDFFGGILTVSIGHADPLINGRIKAQLDKITHTSSLYVNLPQIELAQKLAELAPGDLAQSFFTNSGTEANETAVMLARAHTGSDEVVALRYAYSGRSTLAMSLSGHAGWRLPGANQPGVRHAHNPYCYRCSLGQKYPECDLLCARDIDELIRTTTRGRIAAFIAEPIQGVGGFVTAPKEYFKVAVEIVHRHGGLFICDEVQTGWGRTGKHIFGVLHWDVVPDISTYAKGLANGVPIGATLTTPEIGASLKGATISTFGGNPVSMTAASATLDVIVGENLADNAETMGRRLRDGLDALAERYGVIGEVRGMGLMQGVELVKDRTTKEPGSDLVSRILEETRRRGLLLGKGGMYGNVLRITPMLNVSADEIDHALSVLDQAFSSIAE